MDILLAALLAVWVLLPGGPQYLGAADATYASLGFVALLVLWLVSTWREPRRDVLALGRPPGREVWWAWAAFLVIATGATLVGLSAENDLTSPVFRAHLRDLPADLVRPINMLAHPLYPLAIWTILVQGGVTFAIVRDLCLRAPDPNRRARLALSGWFVGYVIVASAAVIQYVTRFQLHPYWVAVNPDLIRSHATFEDPNMLGSYLVLGLGLPLSLVWNTRPSSLRLGRWSWLLVVLGGLALYTTVSRAAWIALAVTVVLVLAFAPRAWAVRAPSAQRAVRSACRVLVVSALVVASVISVARLVLPPVEGQRLPTTPLQAAWQTLDPRVPTTDVLTGRIGWWRAAARMFWDHPLIGVGVGRYPRLVGAYAAPDVPPENAHNVPLQVLAEMGGLGFAALGLLVAAMVLSLLAAGRAAPPEAAVIARGGYVGTIAFLVTCLAGHPLLLASGQTALATLLAAVLVAVRRPPVAGEAPRPRPAIWKQASVAVAALGLLWYPAAAFGHMARAWDGAPWGYAWGLFPEETIEGVPFRWTGPRALIDLEVPPTATGLELEVAVPTPTREGRQVRAIVGVGDREVIVRFDTSEWRTIRVPLAQAHTGDRGRLQVSIEVEPVFVPAEVEGSDDPRHLGLQLLVPRWN